MPAAASAHDHAHGHAEPDPLNREAIAPYTKPVAWRTALAVVTGPSRIWLYGL